MWSLDRWLHGSESGCCLGQMTGRNLNLQGESTMREVHTNTVSPRENIIISFLLFSTCSKYVATRGIVPASNFVYTAFKPFYNPPWACFLQLPWPWPELLWLSPRISGMVAWAADPLKDPTIRRRMDPAEGWWSSDKRRTWSNPMKGASQG